jgi:hypothetical protein
MGRVCQPVLLARGARVAPATLIDAFRPRGHCNHAVMAACAWWAAPRVLGVGGAPAARARTGVAGAESLPRFSVGPSPPRPRPSARRWSGHLPSQRQQHRLVCVVWWGVGPCANRCCRSWSHHERTPPTAGGAAVVAKEAAVRQRACRLCTTGCGVCQACSRSCSVQPCGRARVASAPVLCTHPPARGRCFETAQARVPFADLPVCASACVSPRQRTGGSSSTPTRPPSTYLCAFEDDAFASEAAETLLDGHAACVL